LIFDFPLLILIFGTTVLLTEKNKRTRKLKKLITFASIN